MHSTPKDNAIQSMHGTADVNFKPYPESFSRSNQGPALGLRLHSYLGAAVCFSGTQVESPLQSSLFLNPVTSKDNTSKPKISEL